MIVFMFFNISIVSPSDASSIALWIVIYFLSVVGFTATKSPKGFNVASSVLSFCSIFILYPSSISDTYPFNQLSIFPIIFPS